MTHSKPLFEVADIARKYGVELMDKYQITALQKKVLTALCNCRTAVLGGHVDACNNCGTIRISYNGCRDRHCPKCNGLRREKWVMDRKADALPVPYFHIVFTIPGPLEKHCLEHGNEMYNLLFKAAWDTIDHFARDKKYLGADMGMISILHTCLSAVQDFGRRRDKASPGIPTFIAWCLPVVLPNKIHGGLASKMESFLCM
jgi:hypothetical protein